MPHHVSILHSATLIYHSVEHYTFLLMSTYIMKLRVRTLKKRKTLQTDLPWSSRGNIAPPY
jgi:hypothetical protein